MYQATNVRTCTCTSTMLYAEGSSLAGVIGFSSTTAQFVGTGSDADSIVYCRRRLSVGSSEQPAGNTESTSHISIYVSKLGV